jgi:hypothetical protein
MPRGADVSPGKGFFDAVYRGRAPWDVEAPPPDLMAVVLCAERIAPPETGPYS